MAIAPIVCYEVDYQRYTMPKIAFYAQTFFSRIVKDDN